MRTAKRLIHPTNIGVTHYYRLVPKYEILAPISIRGTTLTIDFLQDWTVRISFKQFVKLYVASVAPSNINTRGHMKISRRNAITML